MCPVKSPLRTIIIGAGMGGLATAMRLAAAGYKVTVFEKNKTPGGRSNRIDQQGFKIDTGPTILVMKETIEDTYRAAGMDLSQRVNLTRLEPNYRIYYHDNDHLDLSANPDQMLANLRVYHPDAPLQYTRFMTAAAKKYRLGMQFVNKNYDSIMDIANFNALIRLIQTRSYDNLYRHVKTSFGNDEKLTKAFSFHSMFLGLSPMEALAMYSLITYADLQQGMWYPQGGIYHLVEDMLDACKALGVKIYLSAEVDQILCDGCKAYGIALKNGERYPADFIVSNADLPYSENYLLRNSSAAIPGRFKHAKFACSGFLVYLALNKNLPWHPNQSLYFSQDYEKNLREIFNLKVLPSDPSFHLHIPFDPALTREGSSMLYLLAPVPNLDAKIDWQAEGTAFAQSLIHKAEKLLNVSLSDAIVWQQNYTPNCYQTDFNACKGTAFGSLSHHFFQSTYFRPHNIHPKITNLYFVGQSTYPGIGMPMVHISAKLVCDRIKGDFSCERRNRF